MLVGEALEVAKHDRASMSFGQVGDLLLEPELQVVAQISLGGLRLACHFRYIPLVLCSPCGGRASLARDAVGHGVQPGSERYAHSKGRGFLDENQEGRLKRIFGCVLVAQDAPADALHERTMPLDEDREGQFGRAVLARQELLEQLAIRQTAGGTVLEQDAEESLRGTGSNHRHGRFPRSTHAGSASPSYYDGSGRLYRSIEREKKVRDETRWQPACGRFEAGPASGAMPLN